MKTLLLAALLPLVSLAYEVSSLSTESSPTFIYTEDGESGLDYPVASGNTFGSPEWYDDIWYVGTPSAWKMVVDGNVISNRYGYTTAEDGWHTFDWLPENPYYPEKIESSTGETSEWFVTYDFMKFNHGGMFGWCGLEFAVFPDMSTNEGARAYVVDYPYDDWGFVQSHDISGPGTIEFLFEYESVDGTYITNSATLFPVTSPLMETSVYTLYPDAYDTHEIYLPGVKRLTPSSRSALMAAYEAYFERMYYGSRGVTDGGENRGEWTLWQLGSPDADADFVFRSPTWSTYTPAGAGILDAFSYPHSAYSAGEPSARRHHPAACPRLVGESDHVAQLAYSIRHLSPFAVRSEWLGHGAIPDETLRNETPFLSRPQWLLDGRTVPGHHTAINCDRSYLWWSSQVNPPAYPQPVDTWVYGDETYVPSFSVFPGIPSPAYFAEDEVVDQHIPFDVYRDLVKFVKPAQYAFTLNTLPPDLVFGERFSREYPIQVLFGMLYDISCHGVNPAGLLSSTGHITEYLPYPWSPETEWDEGLTVLGFVTNCIRQAARSLPLRSDAMAAYESRLSETSETFRVDSAPVAAASHLLGLMDRTIHVPFQEFVSTNRTVLGRHGGVYGGTLSGDATNVIRFSYSNIVREDGAEWAIRPDPGWETAFSVSFDRTNVVESCELTGEESVDASVVMFARAPGDVPVPGTLSAVGWAGDNWPHKSFKVGQAPGFRGGAPGWAPEPGEPYVIAGPASWDHPGEQHRIAYGPWLDLYGKGGEQVCEVTPFTNWYDEKETTVVVARKPIEPVELVREYRFCDGESVSPSVTLGPVQDPSVHAGASSFAGVLLGGCVKSTRDDAASGPYAVREYDFIQSVSRGYSSRSDLSDYLTDVAAGLSLTLSGRITDAVRGGFGRDPRDPSEYAPMPDSYRQNVSVAGGSAEEDVPIVVLGESKTYETRMFEAGTADKYTFDVVTSERISGYVDFVCRTSRVVQVIATVDEYWDRVDSWSDEFYLDHAVTNIVDYYEGEGTHEGTVKVRDDTVRVSVTSEVTRVVLAGGDILPETRIDSSNVTYTTAFDAYEHVDGHYEVTEWRKYYDTYDYYDYRLDNVEADRPWTLSPEVRRDGVTRTYEVELNPADAKSHEVITVAGEYRYAVVLRFDDTGKVASIQFEPENPDAPSIPEVDEYVVNEEGVPDAEMLRYILSHYDFKDVVPDVSTNANWTGSFDGAARPAVMTWTDWTWNALKRD